MVPLNDDTSMADASRTRKGGGCSRKRKRREPTVESHIIIGHSTPYHPAEYGDQGKFNEKVFVTAHQALFFNQDVLDAGQQTTVDANIEHAKPAPSAFVDTATKISKVDCNHVCSENVNAEQVCFGMVCITNSC